MNPILKQNGIYFGLILGVLLFIPSLIGAYISIDFLLSNYTFIAVIFSAITVGIITVIVAKKKLNGLISMKECFSTYFVMILIGLLLCSGANFVFFNMVEKGLVTELKSKQIVMHEDAKKSVLENESMIDEEKEKYITNINEAVERIRTENPYSISSIFKGMLMFTIIFSIFGLLISMILKTPKQV